MVFIVRVRRRGALQAGRDPYRVVRLRVEESYDRLIDQFRQEIAQALCEDRMLPVGIEFDERGEDKSALMQSRMGNRQCQVR